ncbi:MAG: alpha/beta fold hydrolase, partial [Acidobacteria bacterium]|nr:alpha/beta fold hydrolase [Acidobacteriota bacterium]NIQ86056.1 alpha/beta fold hydrolase [Acidobacteriota bacterium]
MVLFLFVFAAGCAPEEPEVAAAAEPLVATTSSADGVSIEYEMRGAGPVALVFIHGWTCDRTHWRYQVDTFAEGHTVVALDLAGHGKSGGDRGEWTIEGFGADVQAVVEALELPRVILVGHSLGGPVALAAAARMPERVLGVVGVDTLHNVEQQIDAEGWDRLIAMYENDFVGTCERFAEMMFPEPTEDPELPSWTRENMCDADPEIAIAISRMMPKLDTPALLAAAGVPVRCINSTKVG